MRELIFAAMVASALNGGGVNAKAAADLIRGQWVAAVGQSWPGSGRGAEISANATGALFGVSPVRFGW